MKCPFHISFGDKHDNAESPLPLCQNLKSRMGKGKIKRLVSLALFLEVKIFRFLFWLQVEIVFQRCYSLLMSEKASCIHECLMLAACQKPRFSPCTVSRILNLCLCLAEKRGYFVWFLSLTLGLPKAASFKGCLYPCHEQAIGVSRFTWPSYPFCITFFKGTVCLSLSVLFQEKIHAARGK